MITTVQDKKISYEILGRGRTILFVHGWGGSRESMRALAELSSKKYQSVILDLPGFGESDYPDPTWGVEEYSQLLAEFLRKLKLDNFIYFGHSFGGACGIYLAANKPETIEKLILCAPSYKRPAKKINGIQLLKRIVPHPLKMILYRILFPQSDISKFPKLEMNFRKIVKQDLSSHLEKINKPTLILWGTEDSYVPVKYAYELEEGIKDSVLKIFPGHRHSLPLKYPELVYKEINKFI